MPDSSSFLPDALVPGISAVIPVYNAEGSLESLHRRLTASLSALAPEYEILFIEDCGGDRSWEKIEDLARLDPHVRGFRMSRNFGQHNALLCGIRLARYSRVATLDDDLQNPPEELPLLKARLEEGFDVVYGTPRVERHGLLRDLASRITKLALKNAMGSETADQVSAFRIFRTDLRRAFENYSGAFVNIDVLLTWGAARFSAVQVNHEARPHGTSNYTFGKLMEHALNMMTGFSVRPLRIASLAGFGFAVVGFGLFGYVVIRKLTFGTPVPGFPFLASAIAMFAGVQLLSLGVIGEYLARVHFRVMDKPAYNVRDRTAPGDASLP